MTVAKKIGTKQLKIKSGTFEKWLWRKTSEPNSVIKINDSGNRGANSLWVNPTALKKQNS